MTTDEKLAVSIPTAAKLLDCSPATVRRAVERGQLRAVHLMGKLIPMVELERHLGIKRPVPSSEALVEVFAAPGRRQRASASAAPSSSAAMTSAAARSRAGTK